jgi:hypothetical protein
MSDVLFRLGLLEIHSLGFLGQHAYSPNMQFLFGWQDVDYRSIASGNYCGGARSSGSGRVLMLQGDRVLWARDVERPNDGAVSDNGYSIVNDGRLGEGLKGTFYAFAQDGSVLVRENFQANLFKGGIALDGRAAWCTTLASDVDEDSNKLVAFTLVELGQKLRIPQPRLEILGIRLLENGVELQAATLQYRYRWTGDLINSAEAQRAEEQAIYESGSCFELMALAERKIGHHPPREVTAADRTWLEALLRRVTEKNEAGPLLVARADRLLGEIALACGEKQDAAAHFRCALALDPKVGVKRVLGKLEKETGV